MDIPFVISLSFFIGEHNRQIYFFEQLNMLKGANTEGMKTFFSDVKCTDSQITLNEYLQNDTPIPSCNDLNTYENSPFKAYKKQTLIEKSDSAFKPLSSYMDKYGKKHLYLEGVVPSNVRFCQSQT